jgi:hypothetical protein
MNRLDTESASTLGHIYACRRTNTDYCIYPLQTFSGVSPEFLRPNNVQTLAIRQFLGAVSGSTPISRNILSFVSLIFILDLALRPKEVNTIVTGNQDSGASVLEEIVRDSPGREE